MSDRKEILLGNSWHTLYSDEAWYLVFAADSGEVCLEGRFDSDAPDRSGRPTWVRTEFCVSDSGAVAVCRVPYDSAAELLAATRISFVTEGIWAKAVAECRKRASASEG